MSNSVQLYLNIAAAQSSFSFPFPYLEEVDITAYVDGVSVFANNTSTGTAVGGNTYVVAFSAPNSGTLTFSPAVVAGSDVRIERNTNVATKVVDFADGAVLTEVALDSAVDQLLFGVQEAIDTANASITLTPANKWDAGGSIISNVGTPTATTDAATKAYADNISSSAATAAVTAANAAVTAATGAIIPDATKLAIHPVGTQYTLSDGVTTDYSAKHYANEAATEATNAGTQATNATTQATAAAASAVVAQAAEASALAAFDSFDDRYLGVFTTALEPVVDNDGNALVAGSLYFNSTDGAMKVYTGSAWVAAYVSGAGYLAASNNLSDVADAPTSIANLGGLPTAGGTMTGDINYGDSIKANFGAGNDLQIYHDGGSSWVSDVGVGNLKLSSDGAGVFLQKGATEFMGEFLTDGAVRLYYDNAAKFETTATGVTVTGTAVATTSTASITGNTTLDFAANQNFVLTLTGAVTLDNPTTEQVGQSGFITFIQGGSGSYTVSLGTDYESAGGAGLTLSTAVGATDIVPYVVAASGRILLGTPQLAFA